MPKQEGARGARHGFAPTLIRLLILFALCPVSALAGCGGQVVVSEENPDSDDPSPEGGTSGGANPGGPPASLASGNCFACDGEAPCAFCLVHAYNATYVCPTGKSPTKFGCMSLGEEHVSAEGVPFTCYYCN